MVIALLWWEKKTVREVFRDCDGQIRYPTLKGIREKQINRITVKTLIKLQKLYCDYQGQKSAFVWEETIAIALPKTRTAGEIYKQTGLDRDTLKAALRGELTIAALDTYWRLWQWARETLKINHFDDLVVGRHLLEPPAIWLEDLFVLDVNGKTPSMNAIVGEQLSNSEN
ncbi:MAG: hypothetical protein J7647_29070 [Cyanobacteria bacterium SBLK]|nr:hypothetical protein [Cyanobacteria bacterium SBLK]